MATYCESGLKGNPEVQTQKIPLVFLKLVLEAIKVCKFLVDEDGIINTKQLWGILGESLVRPFFFGCCECYDS